MTGSGGASPAARARWLVPLALFLVATALAELVGFDLEIPWSHFQILDRAALERDPLGALWLLHSQPPVLNALLACALRAADIVGTSPELVLKGIYLAVGLGSVVLFHDLVRRASGSTRWAALAAAAMAFEPAFHFYGNHGWYPFLVRGELVLLAWGAQRLLDEGARRHLLVVLAALVALPATRSLFHPAWSFVAGALLVGAHVRRHPERSGGLRGVLPAVLVALLLSGLWPLKNAFVFGRFTYSTLTGINLSRITDVDRSVWMGFMSKGRTTPEADALAARFSERYGAGRATVVTSPEKSDGSRNWNHVMVLEVGPDLAERSLRWRWEQPGRWLLYSAVQYFMWARPAHTLSYTGEPRGPDSAAYRGYAGAWERAWFTDVRAPLERLTPELPLHRLAILRATGEPLPYTLFGLLWFPLGLVLVAARLSRRAFRSTPAAPLVVLCLWATLWTLVVPCLTDGIEANRMRFSTAPLWLTALVLCARRGARPGSPGAEP